MADGARGQEILLWGSESETKAAQDALIQWVSKTLGAVSNVKASKSMPSVHAQTQKTHKKYLHLLRELAYQQAFKKEPDEGAIFEVTVSSGDDPIR